MASDSAIIFASILRQLVAQCLSEKSDQSFIDTVMGRFLENNTIFSGEFVLSSLEWIGDFFSEIFIIIDGVDECSNRDEFCESLRRLVERTKMSVLVVSRPEHEIATADVFIGKSTLNIDDAVKLDISTHVRWYMEKDKKLQRYRPELKADLLVELTTKCDGMWNLACRATLMW